MNHQLRTFCIALSCVIFLGGADWRQFRGNDLSSVSSDTNVPTKWSKDENIAWKVALVGRGLSCPIIVGDNVIVTASSGSRQDRLHVICFDAANGEKRWERQFWATGSTMCHPKMAIATSNPASDGKHIFAFYSSNDLVCLDLAGNLLWFRGLTLDFPNARNSLGMASSPIVVDKTLVVQVEADSEAHAFGLNTETGITRWRLDRKKAANWTSPTVLKGKTPEDNLVLLQSSAGIDAVVPATGETIWSYSKGASTIPSSVVSGETVYIPSNGLTALRPEFGKSEPDVSWQENRLSPGTPSPLVLGDQVYIVNKAGVLVAADTKTGKVVSRVRLKGPFTGSPVATRSHIYLFNEKGLGHVVKVGEKLELVAENDLGETFLCTPAIANNAIYIRSDKHLWKIAK